MPSHPRTITTLRATPRTATARWDQSIPPPLRPLVRAYLLGYGITVGPRVVSLLARGGARLVRGSSSAKENNARPQRPEPPLLEALAKTLGAGLEVHRFATFCAALIGGSTLFQPAVAKVIANVFRNISSITRTRLARWLSTAIAAYFSVQLLQTPYNPRVNAAEVAGPDNNPMSTTPNTTISNSTPQAGRTLDQTLFAATRAVDVIIGTLWAQRRRPATATGRTLERLTSQLADPLVFACASGVVMWNWIYTPDVLPRSYNTWIASAAVLDERLRTALQRCRSGMILYGVDTGQAPLLQPLCVSYGLPPESGDPAVTIPYPCEMVHMGCSPSCEVHALNRFCRSWLWSLRMYLPLQLIVLGTRAKSSKDLKRDVLRTILSAGRSSAFLAAFISLFYYGACLARTRVGPRLLGTTIAARQRLDGGISMGTGCFMSGWSVLIEKPGRRQDLALFVAPRAVATLLPRRYGKDKEWIERLVFAASTAVVFTSVLEEKSRVRGVVGSLLKGVLAA